MRSGVADAIRRTGRGLGAAVLLVVAAAASSLLLDGVRPPARRSDPGIAAIDTAKRSRLLILHVDSWRLETATDSTLMPNVARLRARGASWPIETVFEGFTVPAVRAAFTGRAETQLVNLIRNFSFGALPIESFFRDAARAGKRTLIIAVEPFQQFGDYFVQRAPVPQADMYAADRLRPAMALHGWNDERFDIVICHYESADWVAHEAGIASPRYRAEFAYADSLIARFAAALGPDDYLLVYGDHGHSVNGEHKTGIAIPTFALLLGPDVTPGVTAPPMAMTDLRYVASHAIGIRLRGAPYDLASIGRFLPVGNERGATDAAATAAPLSARDIAVTAVAWAVLVALAALLLRRLPGPATGATTLAAIGALVVAELAAQRWWASGAVAFPLLLVAVGVRNWRRDRASALAALSVGAWLATRIAGDASLVRAPAGLASLIPLDVAAVAAKVALFAIVGGRARWRGAIAWTAASTLVELRVWDSPVSCAALFAAGAFATVRSADAGARAAGRLAAGLALFWFTARLPLYQLAWVDLFLATVAAIARAGDDAWVDALIVLGAFGLSVTWLPSGLEWGFLYTMFPAHLVELEVQYFVPFIVAKLPLLLLVAMMAAGRRPTQRLAAIGAVAAAAHLAVAWAMRLGGASGAESWPLVERGLYLCVFAAAIIGWGWAAGASAVTPSPASAAEVLD